MNKIVIAGGSGYLGTVLASYFSTRCNDVVILSRRESSVKGNIRYVIWDGQSAGNWTMELEGADALINLAGKSVNCRYTQSNRKQIFSSRIRSTSVLGEAIASCENPPGVWINSSSATIYKASYDKDMTESSGEIGDDFSMFVCKKWEQMMHLVEVPGTRKVILRTSIVLGPKSDAFTTLLRLVKFGFGGHQGSGNQFVSWVHERDFCNAVEWLIRRPEAEGAYNIVAPDAIPNRRFMKNLREGANTRWGFALSCTLLEIGSLLIRTETELVLKSRKVYPERLLNEGFVFEFSEAKEALHQLCRQERRS